MADGTGMVVFNVGTVPLALETGFCAQKGGQCREREG